MDSGEKEEAVSKRSQGLFVKKKKKKEKHSREKTRQGHTVHCDNLKHKITEKQIKNIKSFFCKIKTIETTNCPRECQLLLTYFIAH